MPMHDYECTECGYREEQNLKVEEIEYNCPSCKGKMHRIYIKAPMGRIGGKDSQRSIGSMRRSFNERFVKKELDDVRHKFGHLFDESLVSAATKRIKEGKQ